MRDTAGRAEVGVGGDLVHLGRFDFAAGSPWRVGFRGRPRGERGWCSRRPQFTSTITEQGSPIAEPGSSKTEPGVAISRTGIATTEPAPFTEPWLDRNRTGVDQNRTGVAQDRTGDRHQPHRDRPQPNRRLTLNHGSVETEQGSPKSRNNWVR